MDKIGFNDILYAIKKLCVLNCIFLVFMSLFRVFFFFYFAGAESFKGLYHYLAQAFVLGFRFDLSVIAYANTLVTLSLLVIWAVGKREFYVKWAKTLAYYYWFMFSLIIVVLVIDFGYYSYFKDHINVVIYGFFQDDTSALIKTIIQNHRFPAATAIVIVLVVLTYYLCRKIISSIPKKQRAQNIPLAVWKRTVFVIVLISLNTLFARGSLRMFPLSAVSSDISPNVFINKLSVNGLFAFGEAIKAHKENSVNDLPYLEKTDIKKSFAKYLGLSEEKITDGSLLSYLTHRTPKNEIVQDLQPNVVVVVMESFGMNLLRYDSKEFDLLGELRKHFESDYVFKNFLPAGLITIHALESIILNIVQRPFNLSVTQTKFAYSQFPTAAPLPYKNAGYETYFVYGGSLRWRQLDTFLPRQGFDKMIGEGSLPKTCEKNQWGVYDEYLYGAILKILRDNPSVPKFIMVMTTTNHPPYSAPSTYKPAPLNIPEALAKVMTTDTTLATRRCITYQYANQKLGEFITSVENSELGKNTIIAATGDHNFWDIFDYDDSQSFFRYSVPFYLHLPDILKPKSIDTSVFGCHTDIMPTLYDISLSDKEYISMGNDLLRTPHIVMNSEGLLISSEAAAITHNDTGKSDFYIWDTLEQRKMILSKNENALKKYMEFHNAAMVVTEYIIQKSTEKR